MDISLFDSYLDNKIRLSTTYFKTIDSTSKYARENLMKYHHNHLIVADMQTAGVGRYDKEFICYKDCGLYFSLIIKNLDYISDKITMIVAIAIRDTFQSLYKINLDIKWINDMFYHNKKVAGILINRVDNDYIIGVGINLFTPKQDNYLVQLNATSIFEKRHVLEKEKIIANIINNIFYYLDNQSLVLSEYKRSLLGLKNWLILKSSKKKELVYLKDINEDGSLIIIDKDNNTKVVNSGEVSIRIEEQDEYK